MHAASRDALDQLTRALDSGLEGSGDTVATGLTTGSELFDVQGSGSDPERTAVEAGLVCRFDWGSRVARLGGWPEPAPTDPAPAAGAGETPGTVGAARGAAAVRAGWVA
ncbi:hypothetical protein [Corynebacterium bovis]|uniref:hypothetical protein n=1 Tax=Corynebacterium bovis TaxID=36808 RepID=UPI00163998BA|nr:hypothetical protein [Corynebacterium bovis]